MISDPYGTAEIRRRVLAAWTQSPARFREDANAEEDYALGGYRDRVVIELAQNAADAALRAGVPGRLRLRLADGVLTAANTGAPLDAAGVEALSTLRASAKRDEPAAAGRFGVGFSAVAAVTDEPAVLTADGTAGVRWSARRTRELVAAIPELAEELKRRDGQVPVLRLPFPARAEETEPGFDTVVRLPLRDAAARELVRRQLADVGPALMLALPGLQAVEIDLDGEVRTITAEHRADGTVLIDGTCWRTVTAEGALDPELLADRPAEERLRPLWRIRWAVPAEAPAWGAPDLPEGVPAVLHAPTPSDERLEIPALLIATFPLAPDRRHVAPGPLTDFLVERAADAYVELLRALPPTPRLLSLVPRGLPGGALDARLRRAIERRLPEAPLLPSGDAEGARTRGRDAVAVDGGPPLLDLLAEVLPGLLPAGWPADHPALATLGVRRLPLADVIDLLSALEREPDWWRRLYEALAGGASDPDSLRALPVPLADGRTVRGPRGLLIAGAGLDPRALEPLGLRFVHPRAAHPLLLRLGAVEAGPREVLADPAVRAAVEGSLDAEDPDAIAEAVLGLVAAANPEPGEEPWLAELALPGEDGDLYPAGELLLPGGPLRDVVAPDAPFGVVAAELVERWGGEVLEAVGVLRSFALLRAEDVDLVAEADDPTLDLDGAERWAEDVLARLGEQELPPLLPELVAVRDLELVEDWEAALRLLAEPPLRRAVVDPAHVVLGDGRRVQVPSYTAWWLRRHPVLDGRRPADLRTADAEELAGLYDAAPEGLDPVLARALGVRRSVTELLAEPDGPAELLDRLADPAREVSRPLLRRLWAALAERLAAGDDLPDPPERVRALVEGVPEVVPAEDALVLDVPAVLPLIADQPLVITAYDRAVALAEALELALASEEVVGEVGSAGTVRPVPPAALEVLPDAPREYLAHERLIVDGRAVSWWYEEGTGEAHACDAAGLARALAWAAGRWSDRLLVEAVLRDPRAAAVTLAERDLEP